jgi:hypothetical protein
MDFAEKVIRFYKELTFGEPLPEGVELLNPFRDERVMDLVSQFYRKYFSDSNQRRLILGINPGRFGAGSTGIPFTDTKRLNEACGIPFHGFQTHEPSSVFIYEMIDAFGGTAEFYSRFFISAICPLGFTKAGNHGKQVNYNYYDSPELTRAAQPFILKTLQEQIDLGIDTSVCYCLGTGKNEKFIRKLNDKYNFFGKVIALEHPRFIMQYRARFKQDYIVKYMECFQAKTESSLSGPLAN